MLSWLWCLLASSAVFQTSWLFQGCSGILWCWVNNIHFWWDHVAFLSSFGEHLPAVKEQMGSDLLRVQLWREGIYRVLQRRVFTSRFCVRAASLGVCAAVCRSSAGSEGCSYLNCSICLNTTLLCVTLQGLWAFVLYWKIPGSYSAWGKAYILMIERVIPKICLIYSLQIYKQSFESSHIMLWVTDVTSLVFSEDPSISVVKEK